MTIHLSRIQTLVCVWIIGTCAGGWSESDKGFMEQQFTRLASGDDGQVELAVEELTRERDPAQYGLALALFNGEVFLWPDREEHAGLVFIGEEQIDEYGDEIVPLFSLDAQPQPVLDERGEPLIVLLYDLQEVETGRRIRALIQPYLMQVELFHADKRKRRVASENIGNKGGLSDVAILQRAIQAETDGSIRRLKRVSLAKLQLKDPNADVRRAAVEQLEILNSPLALPVLKARLQEGELAETDPGVRAQIEQALLSLKRFGFFMDVVQTVFTGISLGSILVLISLGLAIIYGQIGVINMAHGEFMMIGAYATFVVQNVYMALLPAVFTDLFFALSLPVAFLTAGVFGLLLETLVIRHLYGRPLESLLATWGVSLILIQSARSIFGDLTAVKLPKLLSGGFEIAPQVVLPYNRLFIIALAAAIVGSLLLLFFRTSFGLKMRATTQNRDMSACVGVRVRRMDAQAFMLGTGIAGVAGWAMTLIGNVVPNMGQNYIVDSFLVVVTGGVGKLLGTVCAGLGIGVLNKVLEPTFEAVYSKVILLGLIILFLQSRPTGLFPAKGRSEES